MSILTASSATAPTAAAAFYGNRLAIRLMRGALQAAQQLSPALAARMAQAFFCMPMPSKLAARRQPLPVGYELLRMPFERTSIALYRPIDMQAQAPTVLLAHGWAGDALQWTALAQMLRARGLAPVLVDLPAHGRAAGWSSTLPQFARALEYVALRLAQGEFGAPAPLRAIVAHSLGATAAAMACARGAPAQRLVLLAPAGSPQTYTRSFATVFGLHEESRGRMQRRLEWQEAMPMSAYEASELAPRLHLPALVVHDRGDRINPFADGQTYAERAPQARLIATTDLGHRRCLRAPSVMEQVADFVAAAR